VKEDIIALSEAGFREVVLTGVHLGWWGCDLGTLPQGPKQAFHGLLDVLDGIDADVRLRLSSIEPMDLTADLVRRILSHRLICPHLHIPLQSADEGILEAMGRGYVAEQYAELLAAAKETRPEVSLGTDIMVGFPGEDERAFRKTFEFVSDQPFSYLHIFTFSPRPSTPAARLPGRSPGGQVRNRLQALKELDRVKRNAFLGALHGQTRPCLIEWPPLETGKLTALSDNYIRLQATLSEYKDYAGQVVPLTLDTKGVGRHGMPIGVSPAP
jgi:threonylcarbamoyladenosine tRNA methylthiotransferase MtaB